MQIGFRPNKKVQPYFETLTGRGEKTRFLNDAVEFTLNYKAVIEKQNETLEALVNQYQELISKLDHLTGKVEGVSNSLEVLSEQVTELNKQVAILKETGYKAEQPKKRTEEQDAFTENADFMGMALGDISL